MPGQYNTIHRKVNSLFESFLPDYIRSTNDKDYACARFRRKDNALECEQICPNPISSVGILTLDFDKPFYADDNCQVIPPPNLVVYNKDNERSHAHWFLETSVHMNEQSSPKARAFLMDVTNGLIRQLGADPRFHNRGFTKNPRSDIHRTHAIHTRKWSLEHLGEYVHVSKKKIVFAETTGYGRNCGMFDKVRAMAYIMIRNYLEQTYDVFYHAVLRECIFINKEFTSPLYASETNSIAKSISNWVWDRRFELTTFSKQVARANKLAAKRKEVMLEKQARAIKLLGEGLTISDVAREMNTTRKSVYEWLKLVSSHIVT